jgi:hypothetical protein
MMKPVDIFHIGPQKNATSWVYCCLREHPDICCPAIDAIHYFNMYFHRGRDWYASHFQAPHAHNLLFDPSYSYFRSPSVPERIFRENPNARIVCCLRNPVERAFSHYWHEKKKRRFNYRFEEVLENYDLYANWIEPGFYAQQIQNFLRWFPRERLLCQIFDHLDANPKGFLDQLLRFIGADQAFAPSVLNSKINVARPATSGLSLFIKTFIRRNLQKLNLLDTTYRFMAMLRAHRLAPVSGPHIEKLSDVPRLVRDELHSIYSAENRNLEDLLGIQLGRWDNAAP